MEHVVAGKVWSTQELTFTAQGTYDNPYEQVDIWIDLSGPEYKKRVYGFWDGEQVYRVRFVAQSPGLWSWVSGSNHKDPGLEGLRGTFHADPWSEEELAENPLRRGFIRATANGHAFQYADGTPFYYLADTWWAAPTWRYPWYDDDQSRPFGAEMGFKDMVRYRKSQGYNGIAMIASFPAWADDGYPSFLVMDDGEDTVIRSAWQQDGKSFVDGNPPLPAKDMSNEGGRPFAFPGKVAGYESVVPDLERIHPPYFQAMDRKVAFLNKIGMIPFIEAARRDISQVWKRYYPWPESYMRYIHYVFCRYQAYNTLLSPIHYDFAHQSIPAKDFNQPGNLMIKRYGKPPFSNPVSTNAGPSTLLNFGTSDQASWLTFHQIGNWREHAHYWLLTEIYHSKPPLPAMNGEPYYPGFPDDNPPAQSEEAQRNSRSGMYGSFLSGGLAGYIYGAEGMWGGNREEEAEYTMWDALKYPSGDQVRHLGTFVHSQGDAYTRLIPQAECVVPNKNGSAYGYTGWAFCAHTPDKLWFACYFESGCEPGVLRSMLPETRYRYHWFNPRTGTWIPDESQESNVLVTNAVGQAEIPQFPDSQDWACSITAETAHARC